MVRKIRINEDVNNNYNYVYLYQAFGEVAVFDTVEDAKEYALNTIDKLLTRKGFDKDGLLKYKDNIIRSFNPDGFYLDGHSNQNHCYKIKHYY